MREALADTHFAATTIRHVLPRGGLSVARLAGREERLVFVVGSPRSGTTFLARSVGSLTGFVDLGEVTSLKAAIPDATALPVGEAAHRFRRRLETARRLALVPGLRGVEQTPEVAFVLSAALEAYPQARAVRMVRDGRDVACSLLERGWLRKSRGGRDDAHQPYGPHARFWVEPERAREFEAASDIRRAAWAWRRYTEAASQRDEGVLEVRYERLVSEPDSVADEIAGHLGVDRGEMALALGPAHGDSVGRYRAELSQEELDEVELEAGPLLSELGYR